MYRSLLYRTAISCLMTVSMRCSTSWTCPLGPTEGQFEIRVLRDAFISSNVSGVLYPLEGTEWLPSNEPTVFLWQHPAGEVTVIHVGLDGRFSVSVPPGHYCFRATAQGFTTTVGRIDVRNSGLIRSMEIRLPVAN